MNLLTMNRLLTLALLLSSACTAADSSDPNCEGPRCDEVAVTAVGCASLRVGDSNLFQAANGSNQFYYAPENWSIESGIEGQYWLASSLQYFSIDDVMTADLFRMQFTLRLDKRGLEDLKIELEAFSPGATLEPLPLQSLGLERLDLALPNPDGLLALDLELEQALDTQFNPQSMKVNVDAQLTENAFEALTTLLGADAGVQAVSANLTFLCDDGPGFENRLQPGFPQASAAGISMEASGVTVDSSNGSVVGHADQFMLNWAEIKPFSFRDGGVEDPVFAAREAELADLMRPLLAYDGKTVGVESVHAAGLAAAIILAEASQTLIDNGYDPEFVTENFERLEDIASRMATFELDTRFFPF